MSERTCATCKYFHGRRDGGVCGNLKATQYYRQCVTRDHSCDRHRSDPDKSSGKLTIIMCGRGQ